MDKLIKEGLEYLIQYPYVVFPLIMIFILVVFTRVSRKITEIQVTKQYNKILMLFIIYTIALSGVIYLLNTYLDERYKIYTTMALNYTLMTYIIVRIIKQMSKGIDNRKILSKQMTIFPLTKKFNRDKFRKNSQIEEVEFNIIEDELFERVEREHDFVMIGKNNVNLITKITVKEEKLKEYDEIQKLARKTIVNKLNDVHLSILEAIDYSYSTNSEKAEQERIKREFSEIKFPISRLKLDYKIYKEYKSSLDVYTSPLTNIMSIEEGRLDRELIGALQNTAMSKLQSYGYSYFKIFVDIENKNIERKNVRKVKKLSTKNKVKGISSFHNLILQEINTYDKDFTLSDNYPKTRLDIDFELFIGYKKISKIMIEELTEEHIKLKNDMLEFYSDDSTKIENKLQNSIKKLEDFKRNLFQSKLSFYMKLKENISRNRGKEEEHQSIQEMEEFKRSNLSREEIEELEFLENEEIENNITKEEEINKYNNLEAEDKKNYDLKKNNNRIKRERIEKVFNFNFPFSLVESNRIINTEYNKFLPIAKESEKKDKYKDIQNRKVFYTEIGRKTNRKNLLDRELIGSFKNLFKRDFQSVGYTYLIIFEEKETPQSKISLTKD